MPTALEIAQAREARKLAQAGFKPDGSPLDAAPGGDTGGDDDDRGDDDDGRGGDDDGRDDPLQQQIADLQRQLSAANGRAAPSQQQAEEYRRLWQMSEAQRQQEQNELRQQIASLQERMEATNNVFDVNSALTEEERDAIDPALLQTVVKLADKIAQHRAPKIDVRSEAVRVLEEREAAKVVAHRNQVLNDPARGLHQLGALSNDPEFIAWLREDENDMDSVVNSLLAAKSTEEVDRYAKIVAKRIVKFKERAKKPADARTSLATHMRRTPGQKLTAAETEAKLHEAKQLARSRNPADRVKAQQIINSM